MQKKLSRRTLLKTALLVSGGTLAACMEIVKETAGHSIPLTAVSSTNTQFLPIVQKPEPTTSTPVPTSATSPTVQVPSTRTPLPPGARSRVVQIRAENVTTWNLGGSDYWNHVNQSVVNTMVDQGVMNLTGQRTAAEAWRSLMPNYQKGQIIAIKVSFNNTYGSERSTVIDSIIEPVNSIIRGIKEAYPDDINNASIVIFDSSRGVPTVFRNGCLYPGVQFTDSRDNPWGSTMVNFTPASGGAFSQPISKELVKASYVINVPIMKRHGMTGVSMAFKNHYGSVQDPNSLHPYTSLDGARFTTHYNPQVDIYKNPHIADKTILTVGDGIFSAFGNQEVPTLWKSFNNKLPKCLFFSADPVAIDSVMAEHVNQERLARAWGEAPETVYSFLQLAEAAGLGVYERGNPTLNTFKKIDYQKIVL